MQTSEPDIPLPTSPPITRRGRKPSATSMNKVKPKPTPTLSIIVLVLVSLNLICTTGLLLLTLRLMPPVQSIPSKVSSEISAVAETLPRFLLSLRNK